MSSNEYLNKKYDGNVLIELAPEFASVPLMAFIGVIAAVFSRKYSVFVGAALMIIVTIILIWFFRSPPVDTSNYSKLNPLDVVAPSYGTVYEITKISTKTNDYQVATAKSGETLEPDAYRIVTFLSPLDVHVQMAPLDGTIIKHAYQEGSFYPAGLIEKSQHNERNMTEFRALDGTTSVFVVLLAGILARKIKIFPEYEQPQTAIKRGSKYAIIKFGSRVDTIIPLNYIIRVRVGDTLTGGSTVLATAMDMTNQ